MKDKIADAFIKHGPWAILAGILLAVLLYDVRPAIADIKAEHAEMRTEEATEAAALKQFMQQVDRRMETSNYLQRRQCLNEARSQADRESCLKDREDR